MVVDGTQAVEAALAETLRPGPDGRLHAGDGRLRGHPRDPPAAGRARAGAARPIVALTAHVVGSAAEAWREADMDAVLHKPFTLAALAKTLGQFIEPAKRPPPPPQPEPAAAAARAAAAGAADPRLIDPEVAASLASMAAGGKSDFVDQGAGPLSRQRARRPSARLLAAVEAGDAEAAAKAAHALKSMSLNIGAKEVARRAAEIEHAAREGRRPTVPRCSSSRRCSKRPWRRSAPAGAARRRPAAAAPAVIGRRASR